MPVPQQRMYSAPEGRVNQSPRHRRGLVPRNMTLTSLHAHICVPMDQLFPTECLVEQNAMLDHKLTILFGERLFFVMLTLVRDIGRNCIQVRH